MKINCQDCQFRTPIGCSKNSKNSYGDCKKYKSVGMEALIQERNSLLVSKKDPDRLKVLQDKINYFEWGIK